MALTFVRPGELRTAEWSEFDLDAAVWSIAAEKMKMRPPHRVPLAPQALAPTHNGLKSDIARGLLFAMNGRRNLSPTLKRACPSWRVARPPADALFLEV
jgi:integrase